jgi:hypothetical protein
MTTVPSSIYTKPKCEIWKLTFTAECRLSMFEVLNSGRYLSLKRRKLRGWKNYILESFVIFRRVRKIAKSDY